MVLRPANDNTDEDDADPFNKFWEIVETLVQKVSNPVAFATAPLTSSESVEERSGLYGKIGLDADGAMGRNGDGRRAGKGRVDKRNDNRINNGK